MPWEINNKKLPNSKTPLKRKFPGPAGLFTLNVEPQIQTEHKLNGVPCSQNTFAEFSNGPWEQMRNDFKILNERDVYLPDRYNITWLKSMAQDNKLIDQKVPFIAGIIVKVNTSMKTSIVTINLKDVTGQINGMIINELFKDYHKVLTVGSVVVLRWVTVLTMRNTNYLMITANNLVRIYNCSGVVTLRHCTVDDFMHVDDVRESTDIIVDAAVKRKKNDVDTSLSLEDEEILHTIFGGVDADLFEDF